MKTNAEIDSEVALLKAMKPKVRKLNAFGDNHHTAIDAQINVLEQRMTSDQLHDAYGADAMGEDFDENEFAAALIAHDWMTFQAASDDTPSSNWQELVS